MDAHDENLLAVARVLRLLDALEAVGAAPVSIRDLHTFSYFVNVLSPLWEVEPLEAAVLKDTEGPFFKGLQDGIDYAITHGVVEVFDLDIDKARLHYRLALNYGVAEQLLNEISCLPDERDTAVFFQRLAFAFAEITQEKWNKTREVDASWSDPSVDEGRVIDFGDFGEWVKATYQNPAWNVSQAFQNYAPEGITYDRSEKLVMYMRLMKQRADAG